MHWLDPDFLIETHHHVHQFLLNHHGDVDGFLSEEGQQVHVPPHLGNVLAAKVTIGETVTVRGVKPKGADVWVGLALDLPDGERLVDQGPPAKPPKKVKAAKPTDGEVSGTVQRVLFTPHGEPTALLLDSEIIIRFEPPMAEELAEFLVPGVLACASGLIHTTRWGTVMDANYLWRGEAPATEVA